MVTIGQRIARAARQSGLHADGNNVVINDGKAAFQWVSHIHLHVLPRQSGDKLSFAKGMLLRRDRTAKNPAGCCGRHWRSSTRLNKTERMTSLAEKGAAAHSSALTTRSTSAQMAGSGTGY